MYRPHMHTRIYRHHYIPQTSLYSSTYSPVCGGCSRISYHTYSFASQHSFVSHAFIHIIRIHPDHMYYSHPTYSHEFIRTPSSASYALIRIKRIHPHHIHSFVRPHAFIRTARIYSPHMHPTAPHAFIHLAHDACIGMGVQAAAGSCMTCIYSRIAIMACSPITVGPVLGYGSFSCGSMFAFVCTCVLSYFCDCTILHSHFFLPPSPDGWRLDVFYAAIVWSDDVA